ncbi:MAG: TonB-dependent receptor [Gammaproteobacteria bacterium]|nr:TonB-dependent receptor [Gammaproteobacteria bacterium]
MLACACLAMSACLSWSACAAEFSGRLLIDALAELETQGLRLIYSSDLVRPHMRVRTEPSGGEPEAVAAELLGAHRLGLERGPANSWLVVRLAASPQDAAAATIIGIVRDAPGGARSSGIRVRLPGTRRTATTTAAGDFIFDDLEPGRHRIEMRAGDADPVVREINLAGGRTTVVSLYLNDKQDPLGTLVVTSSRYALLNDEPAPFSFLDRETVENQPDLGEDALRAAHRLPGAAGNELSASTHVRGGARDEVLIRLDGLRLYQPFHLKDFQRIFSAIDARVVGGLDVYTGGYPARFGDRMSGVLDVRSLDIPHAPYREIGFSFFNASALAGDTFAGERGDWLVSARRSNLDLLLKTVAPDLGRPRYMDAFGRLRYTLSERNTVSLHFLGLKDEINLASSDGTENAVADDRGTYLWAAVETDWAKDLQSVTRVSHTNINNDRRGIVARPGLNRGDVNDTRSFEITGVEQDWHWQASPRSRLAWGIDALRLSGDYGYSSETAFDDSVATLSATQMPVSRELRASPDGGQYGAFVSNRHEWTPAFTTELGLRWDRQTYTEPASEEQWSPRAGVLVKLAPRTRLRASWGRFHQSQAIDELQIEDGMLDFFGPQRADHAILSLEHHFAGGLDLRVEAYDKRYRDLRPRFENLLDPLVLLPELEPDRIRIDPEHARARGIELLLESNDGSGVSWWTAYALSVAEDRLDGRWVPRSWDQRHALDFGVNWPAGPWNLSWAGGYHTGWPTTRVIGESMPQPDGSTSLQLMAGPRNELDYSPYFTLDFRASRRFRLASGAMTAFIEVSNLTNRLNPCCQQLTLDTNEDGAMVPGTVERHWLGIVPSLGVVWEF